MTARSATVLRPFTTDTAAVTATLFHTTLDRNAMRIIATVQSMVLSRLRAVNGDICFSVDGFRDDRGLIELGRSQDDCPVVFSARIQA
jgi:hypothetical protein